jgi:hypothetical protein
VLAVDWCRLLPFGVLTVWSVVVESLDSVFGFCRLTFYGCVVSYDTVLFAVHGFDVFLLCWPLAFARSVGSEADASRPVGLCS